MLKIYAGPRLLDNKQDFIDKWQGASRRIKLATIVKNVFSDHVVYLSADRERRKWVNPASMVLCNILVLVNDLTWLTQSRFLLWLAHKAWDRHYEQWQGAIANGYMQDTDNISMLTVW